MSIEHHTHAGCNPMWTTFHVHVIVSRAVLLHSLLMEGATGLQLPADSKVHA